VSPGPDAWPSRRSAHRQRLLRPPPDKQPRRLPRPTRADQPVWWPPSSHGPCSPSPPCIRESCGPCACNHC
jgi:hypothetical protein